MTDDIDKNKLFSVCKVCQQDSHRVTDCNWHICDACYEEAKGTKNDIGIKIVQAINLIEDIEELMNCSDHDYDLLTDARESLYRLQSAIYSKLYK